MLHTCKVKREDRQSCQVPVAGVRFEWDWKFVDRISRKASVSNLIRIRPVGAELFYADGQTDRRDETNSRFSQFCEKRLKAAVSSSGTRLHGVTGVHVYRLGHTQFVSRCLYATSREVTGSIFHLLNPSGRTMAVGST